MSEYVRKSIREMKALFFIMVFELRCYWQVTPLTPLLSAELQRCFISKYPLSGSQIKKKFHSATLFL